MRMRRYVRLDGRVEKSCIYKLNSVDESTDNEDTVDCFVDDELPVSSVHPYLTVRQMSSNHLKRVFWKCSVLSR